VNLPCITRAFCPSFLSIDILLLVLDFYARKSKYLLPNYFLGSVPHIFGGPFRRLESTLSVFKKLKWCPGIVVYVVVSSNPPPRRANKRSLPLGANFAPGRDFKMAGFGGQRPLVPLRLLWDCLLWAIVLKIIEVAQTLGLLLSTLQVTYIEIMTKNRSDHLVTMTPTH
jgi:hypothetical protein